MGGTSGTVSAACYAAQIHAALSQSANLAATSSVGPAVSSAISASTVQQHVKIPFPSAQDRARHLQEQQRLLESPNEECFSTTGTVRTVSTSKPGVTEFHHYHHHHHQHHIPFPLSLPQQAFFPPVPQAVSQYQEFQTRLPGVLERLQPEHLRQMLDQARPVADSFRQCDPGWPGTRSLPHTPPAHQPHFADAAAAGRSTAVLTSAGASSTGNLLNNGATPSIVQPRHPVLHHRNSTPGSLVPVIRTVSSVPMMTRALSRQASQRSTRSMGAAASRSLLLLDDELDHQDPAEQGGDRSVKQDPEPGLCSDSCDVPCPCFACCCPKSSSNTFAVSIMCVFVIFFIVLSPLFHYLVPK